MARQGTESPIAYTYIDTSMYSRTVLCLCCAPRAVPSGYATVAPRAVFPTGYMPSSATSVKDAANIVTSNDGVACIQCSML